MTLNIKDPVQRFLQQVVMNRSFFLNLKKIGADSCCRFREKRKNRLTPMHSNSVKMTSPCQRLP